MFLSDSCNSFFFCKCEGEEGEWLLWYQDHLFMVLCIVICDWLLMETQWLFWGLDVA